MTENQFVEAVGFSSVLPGSDALQPPPPVVDGVGSFVKGILVEGDRLITWFVLENVLPSDVALAA